jgi:YD repeat-containing protein
VQEPEKLAVPCPLPGIPSAAGPTKAPPGAEDLTLTTSAGTYTLKDIGGDETTFTIPGTAQNDWRPTTIKTAATDSTSTMAYDVVGSSVRVTRVRAPLPSGVASCSPSPAGDPPAGCRRRDRDDHELRRPRPRGHEQRRQGHPDRSYDALRGHVTGLSDSQAGSFTAAYDADGDMTSKKLPSGLTVTSTRDEAGNETRRQYTESGNCGSSRTWLDSRRR